MTYIEYIIGRIKDAKSGEPIYVVEIAEKMAEHFHMERAAARAAASVAIKRIMDGNLINNLKLFKKGIYYKTELNINRLIADKYYRNYSGYEGPLTILHNLGLIAQAPKNMVVVTNRVKKNARQDEYLGITITPPRVPINKGNILYLQILDVIEKMDKIKLETDNPERIIREHIQKKKMDFIKLLAYADRYYSKSTVLRLAHVISESETLES